MKPIYHRGFVLSLKKVVLTPSRHRSDNPADERVKTTILVTRRGFLDRTRDSSPHLKIDLIQQGSDGIHREFIHA